MTTQSVAEFSWFGTAGIAVATEKIDLFGAINQTNGYAIITLIGFGILIIGGRCVDLLTKYRKQNSQTAQGKLDECIEAALLTRVHYENIILLKDDEYKILKSANTQLHSTNSTLHAIIIDQAKTMAQLQGLKTTKDEIKKEELSLAHEIITEGLLTNGPIKQDLKLVETPTTTTESKSITK